MRTRGIPRPVTILVALAIWAVPEPVFAHCDSLEGPVVQDARFALEEGDPAAVLKWVAKEDEDEVREAFDLTLAVRAKGDGAGILADAYFFETLVRLHRAGEGEAFTGLKPAGSVDPGIAAADEALRSGSAEELEKRLSAAVREGIQRRFAAALTRKENAATSVEAGREYVEAYVDYVHFVESIHRLASHGASHRYHAPAPDGEDRPLP